MLFNDRSAAADTLEAWHVRRDLHEQVHERKEVLMATVQKRTWLSRGPTGHRDRKVAWGYTLQVHGKQERCFRAEWTRELAQAELAARLLKRDTPPAPAPAKTFAEVPEEYLAFKRGKGKRSIHQDEKILTKLKARLGADMPLPEISA
jgi:hypothetical protein